MKLKIGALALLVAFLLAFAAVPAMAAGFDDTTDHWAADAIDAAVAKNLFQGTSETTFSPDLSMSRGMFVTVLGRFAQSLGIKISGSSVFYDVSSAAYYSPYVSWAADKKIVQGVGDGLFAPNDPVTREQMCALFVRFLNYIGYPVPNGTVLNFVDAEDISNYAVSAVGSTVSLGLIKGIPAEGGVAFRPQANATRAEVATVFLRLDALAGIHDIDVSGLDDIDEEQIAEYLTIMLRKYEKEMDLSSIGPKGLEAFEILMNCVRDALDARENEGVKLTREYIDKKYSAAIAEVKDIFKNQMSSSERFEFANKALEFPNLTAVLDYFGVTYADLI